MESALERAAEPLGRARFLLFGGLYTDTNCAAGAPALAEKLGGMKPFATAIMAPAQPGSGVPGAITDHPDRFATLPCAS